MGIKSIGEFFGLFGELGNLKKTIADIKPVLENFDKSENPKESFEKMLEVAKNNPVIDDLLMGTKTYYMAMRAADNAEKKGWSYACLEAVKEMSVNVEVFNKENIPLDGRVIYVSNHPYGLLDSAILIGELGSILNNKKKDLKIIAMSQLKFIKGIEEILYFVNSTNSRSNFSSLKDSLKYLDKGGNLAICPSGTMSGQELKEYPWKNGISSFIAHSSFVVPMWFSGPDHEKTYNLLAKYKKTEKLRRMFSFREAWNKPGKIVYLNIGEPISSEKLMKIKEYKERIQYLRDTAESLKIKL